MRLTYQRGVMSTIKEEDKQYVAAQAATASGAAAELTVQVLVHLPVTLAANIELGEVELEDIFDIDMTAAAVTKYGLNVHSIEMPHVEADITFWDETGGAIDI